jgi:hypothetical protein
MYVVGSVLAAVAVGASLALFASGAGAAPAGSTVNMTTQVSNVPDTTSGTVTSDSGTGFGYVWAFDNVTDKFQVKALGNGTYSVARQVNGTFDAFSEPNTGLPSDTPIDVTGQLHGTISYVVTSTTGPVALPAQEPDGTSSSTILHQLFSGLTVIDGGNDWVFAYSTGTSRMVQRYDTDVSTWGNITG